MARNGSCRSMMKTRDASIAARTSANQVAMALGATKPAAATGRSRSALRMVEASASLSIDDRVGLDRPLSRNETWRCDRSPFSARSSWLPRPPARHAFNSDPKT